MLTRRVFLQRRHPTLLERQLYISYFAHLCCQNHPKAAKQLETWIALKKIVHLLLVSCTDHLAPAAKDKIDKRDFTVWNLRHGQ